jgi:hypothetical protein
MLANWMGYDFYITFYSLFDTDLILDGTHKNFEVIFIIYEFKFAIFRSFP